MKEINLSQCLIRERHKKGISQEELASYLGVSKAAVSKWENGLNYPDITFLPQLAAYFDISIDELIGYEPQLTKEEIRRQYYHLANEFATKDIEEALADCEEIIKKYYSCYPLLLQMTILLLNHAENFREPVLGYQRAAELARRVKTESDDVNDAKQAALLEATCYLMIGKPEEALGLLDETVRPAGQDTETLALAYLKLGNLKKAKEVNQIAMYQHLLAFVGSSTFDMMLYVEDYKRAKEIMDRTQKTAEIYQLDALHPNTMLSLYIASAQVYCHHEKIEEALEEIEKYVNLCTSDLFPLTLHGDDYFDEIEKWLKEFALGTMAPRNEKLIQQSMIQALSENPYFSILKENMIYKNLLKKLEQMK